MKSKMISIIDSVIEAPNGLSLPEIMKITALPKTTAYRTLENLVLEKFLYKHGNNYYLGSVMVRWMYTNHSAQEYITLLRPYLEQISSDTLQTVHLVQKQNNKAVYVDKIEAKSAVLTKSKIGEELELYSTGAGKAILSILSKQELDSYLSQTIFATQAVQTVTDVTMLKKEIASFAIQGYSKEVEQNEKDIQCVGIAIKWASLTIAISITATLLTKESELEKMGLYLKEIRKKIIEELNI